MKRISHRANVIPIIAKADSFTPSEIVEFKANIMNIIHEQKIPIYDFPVDPDEDDADTIEENTALRVSWIHVAYASFYCDW